MNYKKLNRNSFYKNRKYCYKYLKSLKKLKKI